MADPSDPKVTSTNGHTLEDAGKPAPGEVKSDGQHTSYWILSEEERKKGFVRPVRRTYIHLKCNSQTSMSQAIAETYARDPKFYGATFCCHCGTHLPVGEHGEFVWLDNPNEKVGT